MHRKLFKALIFSFASILILFLFIGSLALKLNNKYRPSIYNYESYLAPGIIKKLNQNYHYKQFKEVNEFTQALVQDKAIAGVGSDFQAAQLILDKKIKKIDYSVVFGDENKDWNKRKNLFTETIQNHLENFDQLIYNKLASMTEDDLKRIGFEIDPQKKAWRMLDETKAKNEKEWDHFADFIIPYYSQDKGIAYNINKDTRPHLKDLNDDGEIEELKEANLKKDWLDIFKILHKHNYQRIGWTNAYVDNLMIGAFNSRKEWTKEFTANGEGKLFDFNEKNYKDAIDSFVSFVKNASGYEIRNTMHNFLSGDGLELVNHLIEPASGRSDAAVVYNGDALDAYYSKDNFASVEEGKIRFIRPKHNYILMDGWIISHKLSEEDTKKFLEALKENVYHNNAKFNKEDGLMNLEEEFIAKIIENIGDKEIKEAKEILASIFENEEAKKEIIEQLNKNETLKTTDWNKLDEWTKNINPKEVDNKKFKDFLHIVRSHSDDGYKLFEDIFSDVFSDIELSEIGNFDYISYTPADALTYAFIDKWYFGNDEIAKGIFEQPHPEKDSEYQLFTYPLIENNLRTKIVSYYFEKTKN
ncbi:Hypothetical protein, putative Spermidine/putrescine ABC transporter substrate binding protein (potD) [Metamycoplasma auris 15026]|uniref:Spermidine/putrescine ABC transporter substrate-binding protein n=1 Tax=Metamycoplasma auris 15026 TaxID=1188233 RepID=N9VCG1_9BACT|nr:hypothetical protein [Metamycoplasma auris]ENY69373.1 Hypothetical protein, putative Spermidine/putrescine ABC transporter substrate binding protein (potD) [Metamycoplasma auris 15026]